MPPVSSNPTFAQNNLSSMGSPFSQQRQGQTPFINNASQSPFNNLATSQNQTIPTGFNSPSFSAGTFGNNSQNAIVQSNDKLAQALSKLTQVISSGGGKGAGTGVIGTGTGVNPTPTTANPTANSQTITQTTAQNQGTSRFGDILRSGLRGFAQAGSATSAADLISLIPGVGPMLAAPYKIAGGMAGGIASLQAANKQRMLSAGLFGNVGVGQNTDLTAFAKLGIDPNEAIGMQMQAQNAGFGRFSTQGEGATLNMPMGMNLSRMAGLGFSGGTAGLFQAIGSSMNPNAVNRNGLFSLGFNQGFNDIQMQGLAGGILGLQRNLFNQTGNRMNAESFNDIATLSSGAGAFMGDKIQNIYSGMGNLVNKVSPFGDLGNRILDLSVQSLAPGDFYAQAKERERLKGDPKAVAKILLEQSNGDINTAKAIALSTGLSTSDIDTAFASLQMGGQNIISGPMGQAQAEIDRINELQFGKGAKGSAVNVAAQQAKYAIENVTTYSGKVGEVLAQDRKIQTDKLNTFDPKAAEEALKKMSEVTSAANDVMFKVMKKLSDLIDKIEKVGLVKSITDAVFEGMKLGWEFIKSWRPF